MGDASARATLKARAASFGVAARAYERGRPSYPEAAIDWLLLRAVVGTGTAVLMATHDRLAVEYADRVLIMEDGRLAATA